MAKFKKIQVRLVNGEIENFNDVEWNDSPYGISLEPKEGIFLFWPFNRVLRISAALR